MNLLKRITSIVGATCLVVLPACSNDRLDDSVNLTPIIKKSEPPKEETPEPRWVGIEFTSIESQVLKFLQDKGISDRAALATIMGNIKQESKFHTEICEGGSKTGYDRCYSGGFGLIQWTTPSRYRGLGTFAKTNGLCPNSLEAQLGWMISETEWRQVEYVWKTPGKSIDGYMWAAKRWLGWGIHGNRTTYAHQYYNSLTLDNISTNN